MISEAKDVENLGFQEGFHYSLLNEVATTLSYSAGLAGTVSGRSHLGICIKYISHNHKLVYIISKTTPRLAYPDHNPHKS